MQFTFVDFWAKVDCTWYGVNHGHWHFVFGIEVKQTKCAFQFNMYFSETSFNLRGRVDNVSVAFLKSESIGIPLHDPILFIKSGVRRGIHCTDMFS